MVPVVLSVTRELGGAKKREAASAGGAVGRTAKRTLAMMSPRVQQSTPASEGPAKPPSARPLVAGDQLQVPDEIFGLDDGGHWQAEVVDVRGDKVELYFFDADDKYH